MPGNDLLMPASSRTGGAMSGTTLVFLPTAGANGVGMMSDRAQRSIRLRPADRSCFVSVPPYHIIIMIHGRGIALGRAESCAGIGAAAHSTAEEFTRAGDT